MSRENVEIVRRVFSEQINRDPRLDASWRDAHELLSPDFEYREDPSWPGAGTYRGIAAFRQAVTAYCEALGEMRVEAEEFVEAGDRVVVLYRWWARGASGAEAEMRQAGIFTVREGKIARWQVVFDRNEALKAVGLSE